MWAIAIKILHHSIPTSCTMWSCIYLKCSDGQCFETQPVNMGHDTAETFLDQALAAATICRQLQANRVPMKWLTLEKWNEHNNPMSCSIFAKPFKLTDEKVWDHDHLTGEYRGPGHNACNLNCRINPKKMKISCIIHHFKGILFLCYSSFHIC